MLTNVQANNAFLVFQWRKTHDPKFIFDLFQANAGIFRSVGQRILASEDMEDFLSFCLIELLEWLFAKYDPERASVSTFLFRYAPYLAKKYSVSHGGSIKGKWKPGGCHTSMTFIPIHSDQQGPGMPHQELTHAELPLNLFAALEGILSPREAQAIRMRFQEGKSTTETAKDMGLPNRQGAEYLLKKALKKLKETNYAGNIAELTGCRT